LPDPHSSPVRGEDNPSADMQQRQGILVKSSPHIRIESQKAPIETVRFVTVDWGRRCERCHLLPSFPNTSWLTIPEAIQGVNAKNMNAAIANFDNRSRKRSHLRASEKKPWRMVFS
jgi:hypothetical protein